MWILIRDILIALKRILKKHLAFRQIVPNTFTKFLWTIYDHIHKILKIIVASFLALHGLHSGLSLRNIGIYLEPNAGFSCQSRKNFRSSLFQKSKFSTCLWEE